MQKSIALVGAAGSGKSTLAELLAGYGYARHALADPLKAQLGFMAHIQLLVVPPTQSFGIEPYERAVIAMFESVRNIMCGQMGYDHEAFMRNEGDYTDKQRARDIAVRDYFVRWVNDRKPNFRKALQYYGSETIRDLSTAMGQQYVPWVKVLLRESVEDALDGTPTVCDDVRFPDEVRELRDAGFLIVRVVRPGQQLAAPAHVSEEHWRTLPVDIEVVNDATKDELVLVVCALLKEAM